jgi:glycosyltransferase involved in cell wall biosynthesis/predicted O-methyltransferase YrrM
MHPPGTIGEGWRTYDYVSPGLEIVRPDAAFPMMGPGDHLHHPWKHLRRDVPHTWYVDGRFPLMGFLNRDEAVVLHNIARQFAGRHVLEVGSWLGWSTCHLALAGTWVDVVDPAHDDPEIRAIVEESLTAAGVDHRVHLAGGHSPDRVASLAAERGRGWDLFFIDGDHERPAPMRDALACLPHAAENSAFVFHDLAAPAVADGLRAVADEGFEVLVYQTAQLMGLAWRGDVEPLPHIPDPDVAWQIPLHLTDLPIAGARVVRPQPSRRSRAPAPSPARDLRVVVDAGPPARGRPSVCVVSNEILGLHKNGGIGTSMTGLAETLAAAGMSVTILYTRTIWEPEVMIGPWRRGYAELGIELVTLGLEDLASVKGPLRDHGFAAPFLVYRYLASRRFDVVHFNDCCGDGSLSLAAKRLGVAFDASLFVTALHSPSQWVHEHNQIAPTSLLLAAFDYAERLSVRCTDVLWSPSRYLLDWARANGFALPEHTFVQQYSIPSLRLGPAGPVPVPSAPFGRAAPPREIVFFGRLEERKGLALFCNAVDGLAADPAVRDITVTFLGSPQRCAGMPALAYIARRSSGWPVQVQTLTDLGQPEALRYLRQGDKLAVMPSPADNSPCTVYEAMRWGIPFLAAGTGGIPELIHPDDRSQVLFEYRTAALREALLAAVRDGGFVARPAVTQEETRRVLVGLHARWDHLRRPVPPPPVPTQWAAAIVDHRPGADLGATLDSLAACPWIRRVVVLDRAGDASRPGVTAIDLLGEDGPAVERELAMLAEEAVLLVHSGVSVLPEPLATMLGALEATAPVDGLLPAAEEVDPDGRVRFVPPLGGSPSFSLYEGVTFTGALLVRRRALVEARRAHPLALGSAFVGLGDFCVAGGADIWPYPEPVVRWPAGTTLHVRDAAPARLAAYGEAAGDRHYMLAAGYGYATGARSVSGGRERAYELVELGLAPVVKMAALAVRAARTARARVGATPTGALLRRLRGS